MISCDTNILFPACDSNSPQHQPARSFLAEHTKNDRFCLSEQVLMELYCLLRNPAVCTHPMSAREAVGIIQTFRSNPNWAIVDVTPDSVIMEQVWSHAAGRTFAFRRIFDIRLAKTLQHHGVTQFATRNVKDFKNIGFEHLWNPLS